MDRVFYDMEADRLCLVGDGSFIMPWSGAKHFVLTHDEGGYLLFGELPETMIEIGELG